MVPPGAIVLEPTRELPSADYASVKDKTESRFESNILIESECETESKTRWLSFALFLIALESAWKN